MSAALSTGREVRCSNEEPSSLRDPDGLSSEKIGPEEMKDRPYPPPRKRSQRSRDPPSSGDGLRRLSSKKKKNIEGLRFWFSREEERRKSHISVRSTRNHNRKLFRGRWEAPTYAGNTKFEEFRTMCGTVVENPVVQTTSILLVVINSIVLAVLTLDSVSRDPEMSQVFHGLDRVILSLFSLELLLHLIYRGYSFFRDTWLVVDTLITVGSWAVLGLQIFRSYRVFIASRTLARIGPARELILALGDILPELWAIAIFTLILFYIFAVLFTELFGSVPLSQDYFGSLPISMFTCFQMMTLDWAPLTRELMKQCPWAWVPIVSFVSISGFFMFNLIIAIVCSSLWHYDKRLTLEVALRTKEEYEDRLHMALTKDVAISSAALDPQVDDTERACASQREYRIVYLTDQIENLKARNEEMARAISNLASSWDTEMAELKRLQTEYRRKISELDNPSVAEKVFST